MSDSEKNDLITQFMGVTGVDSDRARFYLESAAWKLEVAMESFFDQGDDVDPEPVPMVTGDSGSQPAEPAPSSGRPSRQPAAKSRFATISSVHSDEGSDSDEGQAYYAGGSEHGGGQQIIDPRKKKKSAESLVKDMFKAAKEHGAEEVGADAPSVSGARQGPRFQGTAYRLGDNDRPSISVPGMSRGEGPKQVDMTLKLWKEGFSVNDGPLRGYQEDENKEFLDSIKRGEVPKELISQAKGGEVNLNMEDHRTENYVKPKVSVKAFTGEGHRLGSPAAVPVALAPSGAAAAVSVPAATVSVNESLPTTNIQIRLADGSRLVQKFNHTHTVAEIRQFIINQRPQYSSANFALMTTFPNKELTDEAATLEGAKLLSAVLVQRMK